MPRSEETGKQWASACQVITISKTAFVKEKRKPSHNMMITLHTESAVLGFVVLLVGTFHRGPEHRLTAIHKAQGKYFLIEYRLDFD